HRRGRRCIVVTFVGRRLSPLPPRGGAGSRASGSFRERDNLEAQTGRSGSPTLGNPRMLAAPSHSRRPATRLRNIVLTMQGESLAPPRPAHRRLVTGTP